MPTATEWSCEYCGRRYTNQNDAWDCEGGHREEMCAQIFRDVPLDLETDGSVPEDWWDDLAAYLLRSFDRKPFVPETKPPPFTKG